MTIPWNRRVLAAAILGAVLAASRGAPAAAGDVPDWPPSLDPGNAVVKSVDGRTIERFVHGSPGTWGYPDRRRNCFFVVHPRERGGRAPLCVVLHSANRTAFDYLGYCFLDRKVDPADDPRDFGEKIPPDFFALFLDSDNDEWWGWCFPRAEKARYSDAPNPTEKRVLDTIEWAAAKYGVDRSRIYLTGVSMGGCGALALAMPHGDVFAAVRVWVPAGMAYMSCRMGFDPPPPAGAPAAQRDAWLRKISAADRPDPPLVVDLPGSNDGWSGDQGVLLTAARDGRLPLIVGWGPFGHTGARSPVAKFPYPGIALAFPWMEVRKDEAYPVFTGASTDQRIPWLHKGEADDPGQINAWFRWKGVRDEPSGFAIRIWLEHPATDHPPPSLPDRSVADITMRRLQRFKVVPGRSYAWELVREDRPVGSGTIEPDAAGLLTVPGAAITPVPAELRLKAR
jgi:hypothetical protein